MGPVVNSPEWNRSFLFLQSHRHRPQIYSFIIDGAGGGYKAEFHSHYHRNTQDSASLLGSSGTCAYIVLYVAM